MWLKSQYVSFVDLKQSRFSNPLWVVGKTWWNSAVRWVYSRILAHLVDSGVSPSVFWIMAFCVAERELERLARCEFFSFPFCLVVYMPWFVLFSSWLTFLIIIYSPLFLGWRSLLSALSGVNINLLPPFD